MIDEQRPLTLAQALLVNPSEWDDLDFEEVTLSSRDIARAVESWHWLCGGAIGPGGATNGPTSAGHVTRDAGLVVALSAPAVEFFEWFRMNDWTAFDEAQDSEDDGRGWGAAVLQRAAQACHTLGPMRGQLPVWAALNRM